MPVCPGTAAAGAPREPRIDLPPSARHPVNNDPQLTLRLAGVLKKHLGEEHVIEMPAKMTSAMFPPRSARAPCSPRTQLIASTRLDLPDPLGPTMTETPGMNSKAVLSAKLLNPRIVMERRKR